jgi:hypothetical protein
MQIKVITWNYTGAFGHWGHAALRVRADPDEYKRIKQAKKAAELALKEVVTSTAPDAWQRLDELEEQISNADTTLRASRERDVYVSWWPGDINDYEGGTWDQIKNGLETAADRNKSYHADKRSKNKSADFKKDLPAVEEGHVFGLSASAIIDWWPKFLAEQKTYSALKMNCSTVVALALEVAGASDFVQKPSPTGWWEPSTVQAWAEQLSTHLAACAASVQQMDTILGLKAGAAAPIMTVKEWQKATDPGLLASRKEHWKVVDNLLDNYHKFAAKNDLPSMRGVLRTIVQQLIVIIRNNPETKRQAAVSDLYCAAKLKIRALG